MVCLAVTTAAPATALPWQPVGAVPLPEEARSVVILRKDEPLQMAPSRDAKRRGSAALGARLPLYGAQRGPGCTGKWLNVGPLAWVCGSEVQLSAAPPVAARPPRWVPNGLPHNYQFAGPNGSLGYARLSLGDIGVPDYEYDPGFAVAILEVRQNSVGDQFGLTTKQLWVPMRDFHPVRKFLFRGAELREGNLDVGWVVVDDARGRRSAGGVRTSTSYTRFEKLTVLARKRHNKRWWYRVAEKQWLSEKELRVPQPAEPPAGIKPGERWIDVDIDHQVVTAYEGTRAVFATISSTGRGKGKSTMATPRGQFRTWVKLHTTDMTNLRNEYANRYYAIEEVPWVMFFKEGYGLHGTFWHRRFGHRKSHGCVNLSPLDAQRLFHWSSPRIPAGWTAALPTSYEPGTLVRVR